MAKCNYDRVFYVTSYCNFPHRLSDGAPIGHECYVLPPKALQAEAHGDTELAIKLLQKGFAEKGRRRHTGTRRSRKGKK